MSRKREAAPPALILLSDIRDQNKDQEVPKCTIINSPKFLIGRSAESNLTLYAKNISRKHCTFNYDEKTKKWSIESHSRQAVSVQGKDLKAADSITLECGDKIKITPFIVFEFKCSPDSQYKCCMDFKRARLSSDDEEEKNEDVPFSNVDDVNEDFAYNPNVNYLLDDDEPFYEDNSNLDEDVVPIPNVSNMDVDDEPISNINIEKQAVPIDNFLELPSTLPLSQLPDSSTFNNSPDDYSNTATESFSFSKIDSNPASPGVDLLPQSSDNLDIISALTIDDLANDIQNYLHLGQDNSAGKISMHKKLNDELSCRLEFIRKLAKFNSSCELYFSNPSDVSILNTSIEKIASFFQDECSKLNFRNVKTLNNKSDENLNRIVLNMDAILMEKTHLATGYIPKFLKAESPSNKQPSDLYENSQNLLADDATDSKTRRTSNHDALMREKTDLQAEMEKYKEENRKYKEENRKYKEENRKYKENMSWQESRIKFLELKMKEKEKLEIALETAKEETESLEKQNSDLKRNLANLEIMELEYKNILETNKYREEDKRSKDALQRTINTLEDQLKVLKDDNAQLLNDKCVRQDEITKFQEKINELEEKIKEKIVAASSSTGVSACRNDTSSGGEYCCDMVKEVKASLIDLMEREFQCSICGEMMIESTVTTCNHVFCSFCLQEWKKKQKKCPICRAQLVKEVRAVIIDNYVTDLLKLISEPMHSERMKVISDRTTKKTPPAPATPHARGRTVRRNSRQAAAIVDLS